MKFWLQREPASVNFHSLPLHENRSFQTSKSVLHLFSTTWSNWKSKTINRTQSSISQWRFRCCRSFLNSLRTRERTVMRDCDCSTTDIRNVHIMQDFIKPWSWKVAVIKPFDVTIIFHHLSSRIVYWVSNDALNAESVLVVITCIAQKSFPCLLFFTSK